MNSDFRKTFPDDLRQQIVDATWERITEGESGADVFRLTAHTQTRYLKMTPHDVPFAVRADMERLRWLHGKLPVPEVLHYAEDATRQYLLMSALPGTFPLHDDLDWTAQERIDFLAAAARQLHALPITDCPFSARIEEQLAAVRYRIEHGYVRTDLFEPQWQSYTPEKLYQELLAIRPDHEDLVVTHGDLYPVNLRADPMTHALHGYLDVGALGIADRYTDLAITARAIGWHFEEVWIERFFAAYGISEIDRNKLAFYQLLDEFF